MLVFYRWHIDLFNAWALVLVQHLVALPQCMLDGAKVARSQAATFAWMSKVKGHELIPAWSCLLIFQSTP